MISLVSKFGSIEEIRYRSGPSDFVKFPDQLIKVLIVIIFFSVSDFRNAWVLPKSPG